MPVGTEGGDADVAASLATYVKLLRATKSVIACIEPGLAAAGLTPTQLGVLEAIHHLGPLLHRDLVRKVLTSAGNLTDVVDKLVARGLVRRERDATDRRLVRIRLTEAGAALIARVFPAHAADIAATLSVLSPAEQATLGDLLRRLGLSAAGQAERAGRGAGLRRTG